jgi:hypothetical protein
MKRKKSLSHVVPDPSQLRPPRQVFFLFVITTADNDVEEDFMNPTLMDPLAIRKKYTPAEVRIFFHSYSSKFCVLKLNYKNRRSTIGRSPKTW